MDAADHDVIRCFVQFIHPGPEHGIDSPGAKGWNVGEHRRKFLRSSGEYVDEPGAAPAKADLVFWGEWEPESKVEPIAQPGVWDGPQWLHTPYYIRPDSYWPDGQGLQNTDPFVFGDHFLYTLCKQSKEGRPTFLRDLAAGSLILFGSHKGGEFILDTALVVAEGVLHDFDNWTSALLGHVTEIYEDVTIRPAYEGFGEHELRLYKGATREEPIGGMFSFVPCLPIDVGRAGFARPSIRLPRINPDLKQGMKGKETHSLSLEQVKELWDAVVKQVLEQNLVLGTRFALPPRRDA
jgi:hypothetical protein